jgi:hypothetical protein
MEEYSKNEDERKRNFRMGPSAESKSNHHK